MAHCHMGTHLNPGHDTHHHPPTMQHSRGVDPDTTDTCPHLLTKAGREPYSAIAEEAAAEQFADTQSDPEFSGFYLTP